MNIAHSLIPHSVKKAGVSSPIYWKIIPKVMYYFRDYDLKKYSAPTNPFKIIYVDPQEISEMTRRKIPQVWRNRLESIGTVSSGEWDIRSEFQYDDNYTRSEFHKKIYPSIKFKESIFYTSLERHFKNDLCWEETEFVKNCFRQVEKGDIVWANCKSREDILQRCQEVDSLYESIKAEGIKSQRELKSAGLTSFTNEILVDIGRNGQFLRAHGRHRLAIAQILDVERIPVAVLVRHQKWMEHRDSVYRNNLDKQHPDFNEFH